MTDRTQRDESATALSPETASASPLLTPIESLNGIGPTRAKHFRALGVRTLGDLIEYFPRDYQYESSEKSIGQLRAGEIQIARGEVTAVDYVSSRGRPRFQATLSEGPYRLGLVFFHGAYLRTQIHPGKIIRATGTVKFFGNIPQMINPKWELVDASTPAIEKPKFRPIYPATGRLPSDVIGQIIARNLDAALPELREWFDANLLKSRRLVGRAAAYQSIHRPADLKEAVTARRRLVYDELMLMQLALAFSKRRRDGRISAPVLRIDKLLDERIRKRFPFELTAAQQNAVWQIVADLRSGRPMNRLLQGDVGSGKTVVALYAMLVAIANRMQAAILAPTEVLAEQHYLTLSTMLAGSSVNITLYTSRTKSKKRSAIRRELADGVVHLAVGTQALVQKDMEFANLGLVVVDEQHRLGVRQRAELKSKGTSPHYLVMTATPIPRTLALSYFADFDLSVINELPPGRQPIRTKWLRPSQSAQAYELIRTEIKSGHQAYIVLPQIEEDAAVDAKSVTRELERLSGGPLKGLRLAAMHGQLSTDEKQATMTAFRDGRIDVLVSTTVIEVGIDVPGATVILIDNADRFGLSQLHQLRGRVGRGSAPSHCILVADPLTPEAETRLTAMTRTTSGFDIAEIDLKLRGPGEFFGTRQHGLPEFKLADVTQEMELLAQAKEDALALLADDPKLHAHPLLREQLAVQFGDTLGLAQIG